MLALYYFSMEVVMVAFTYSHIILMGLLMGCVIDCVLSKWIHFTLAAVMDLHTSSSVVSMTSGSNDTRFSHSLPQN